MKFLPYITLLLLAPLAAGAQIYSNTSATANTGGVTVISGSQSTSNSSASVQTSVNVNSSGTAVIEITKEENGVRTTERREERVDDGRTVEIRVGTSTSVQGQVRVQNVRPPIIRSERGDAAVDVPVSASATTTGTTTPFAMQSWFFDTFHEIVALFTRIFNHM